MCVCILLDTSMDTRLTPEAHVKRSIVVRTVETRDGEVNAVHQPLQKYPFKVFDIHFT